MEAGALFRIFFLLTWKMNQWKMESQALLLPLSSQPLWSKPRRIVRPS